MGKHGNKYQVNLHRQKIAKIALKTYMHIQGGVEGCADILTCNRTSQKVTIKTIMSYTNADIFREKKAKSFSKKVWKPLNFMKNHSRLFLLSFNSKLSHFDKNINLFSQLIQFSSVLEISSKFSMFYISKTKRLLLEKKLYLISVQFENTCIFCKMLHQLQCNFSNFISLTLRFNSTVCQKN
jgi:hypothetical protein